MEAILDEKRGELSILHFISCLHAECCRGGEIGVAICLLDGSGNGHHGWMRLRSGIEDLAARSRRQRTTFGPLFLAHH